MEEDVYRRWISIAGYHGRHSSGKTPEMKD